MNESYILEANDVIESGDLEIFYMYDAPKQFVFVFQKDGKKKKITIAIDKINAKDLVRFIVDKL